MSRPATLTQSTCLLCPEPRAKFQDKGRTRYQRYCKAHQSAYAIGFMHARRHELPRAGLSVLLIYPRFIIRLTAERRSVVPLKFPDRWKLLMRFFAAEGWTVTNYSKDGARLERLTQAAQGRQDALSAPDGP